MSATEHATALAIAAARAAADKKAEHLTAIDVSERLGLTDVFLLASGANDAHWVLVDYGDVVVHVLQNEDREFYSLERLWKDCPAIELPVDLTHENGQDSDSRGRETTAS